MKESKKKPSPLSVPLPRGLLGRKVRHYGPLKPFECAPAQQGEGYREKVVKFDTWMPIFYTSCMLTIAVIDGQGGGIGSVIVKMLRDEFGDAIEIIALGTNAAATTAMMKSRANKGATGENAIVWNSERVDMIIGPLSIALPDAMLGEVTAKMASAVVSSQAKTVLLPLNQEGVEIAGVNREPLPHLIEQIITKIKETCDV
jgi:hypothetical protein